MSPSASSSDLQHEFELKMRLPGREMERLSRKRHRSPSSSSASAPSESVGVVVMVIISALIHDWHYSCDSGNLFFFFFLLKATKSTSILHATWRWSYTPSVDLRFRHVQLFNDHGGCKGVCIQSGDSFLVVPCHNCSTLRLPVATGHRKLHCTCTDSTYTLDGTL